MGRTVSTVVNAVVEPVKTTVANVKESINEGKPLEALGNVAGVGTGSGGGAVGVVKGLFVDAGKDGAKALYGDVSGNTGQAVSEGVTAYMTGGASLVATAGQSVLSGLQGQSLGQLSTARPGGGAPMLSNAEPIYTGGVQKDFTGPVAVAAVMLGAFVLIKGR